MKRLIALMLLAACGGTAEKPEKPAASSAATSASPAVAPLPGAAPGDPKCPATGLWARCSVLYRLGRSALAPHLDSTEKVEEKSLHPQDSFVIKFGSGARLEIFLYADSTSRIADAKKLDPTLFKKYPAELTINRERTIVQNGNAIALLTSIDNRLRERVDDALSAGAPQPSQPVTIKP